MNQSIYIGLDTGVKTGLAVWHSTAKALTRVETVPIHRALETVKAMAVEAKELGNTLTVVFEDARQRKWIPNTGDIRREMGRRLGAGSVKRDARIWQDFLDDNKIAYLAVKPQQGWTKLSPEKFQAITGYTGRTSEHGRDAAMLVFGR